MKKLFLLLVLVTISALMVGCTTQIGDLDNLVDEVEETPSSGGGGSGGSVAVKQTEIIVSSGNTTCFDSDGGNMPYERGYTTLEYPDGSMTVMYDKCIYNDWGEAYNITEYFCEDGDRVSATHYCEFGCYNGECFSEPVEMPEIHSSLHAFKHVDVDTQEVLSLSADINTMIIDFDLRGRVGLDVFCFSDGNYHSTYFSTHPFDSSFSGKQDYAYYSLAMRPYSEESLAMMNCYRNAWYGPFNENKNILSGGISFPSLHNLRIIQELGSTDYYLNFVGSSQVGIRNINLDISISYPGNQGYSIYFYKNYDPGVTSFNEMIPINLTGNETRISIYASARTDEPYAYTSAWKEYVLSSTIPERQVEETKQTISSSGEGALVEVSSGYKQLIESTSALTEEQIAEMNSNIVEREIQRIANK